MIKDKIIKTKKFNWKKFEFIQQENFKDLTETAFERLKNSIVKNGFVETFKAWEDPGSKKVYCLDGYHRCVVFKELEKEGLSVPALFTTNFIECKNKQEAGKLVLTYSSIYAKITEEGLYEFINLNKIDLQSFKDELFIPEFNLEYFNKGYLEDGLPEEVPNVDIQGQVDGMVEYIIIKFNDPEAFERVRETTGLKGAMRQLFWNDIIKNLKGLKGVEDAEI